MRNQNSSPTPPRWIDRLLEWFCADEFLEIVQGDLHELYRQNVAEYDKQKADSQYLLDVLSLFRPFALGFTLPDLFYLTASDMYKNYLLIALRNFRRQLGFSVINVLGLAIGIAAFMIILTYVSFEMSYDKYHNNKDRLFRWHLKLERLGGEVLFRSASVTPGLVYMIREEMPEVDKVGRLYLESRPYTTISHTDKEDEIKSFYEDDVFYAESSLLSIFDIDFIFGDGSALNQPNTVIISESIARKYFGTASEEIIGEMIEIASRSDALESNFLISGIYADFPPNSHVKPDFLLSFRTLIEADPERFDEQWNTYGFYTYMLLHPNVTEEEFQRKKPLYVKMIMEKNELNNTNPENKHIYDWLRVDNIHLQSDSPDELTPSGNLRSIYILILIGFILISIAWVNYVNLTTAKSIRRAKEVGIRKTVGAKRDQLFMQFLSESFFLNLFSALLAILIIWLCLPYFRQLTGAPLSLQLWWEGLPNTSLFFIVLGMLFVLSTLLSGFYPAVMLSSFHPLKTIKGELLSYSSKGINLRSGLVVVQFTISIILIAGTYLMYKQVSYMLDRPLGFDKEQMLIVQSPIDVSFRGEQIEGFKNELLRQAFVEEAAFSSTVPGQQNTWDWALKTDDNQNSIIAKRIGIDHDFMDAYNFTFAAGRNFSKDRPADKDAIIINESAVSNLGFNNVNSIINQEIQLYSGKMVVVIGVVKDYHHSSLKEEFYPICFLLESSVEYNEQGQPMNFNSINRSFVSVKISTSNLKDNLKWIEEKYQTYFPGVPLKYNFLDEGFEQQYRADLQFTNIFGIFAGLAIFIACLGILGLSSFLAVQKSKEIGIRKVMGARVSHIVLLLSGKFVRLILLAALTALPLAYYLADQWLENYAFRIEIGWWFFIIPAVSILVIAILTISVQTIRAALANPVNSLKHE